MSTQIRGNKQIKNITIENDQIIDSTIELNKLKEGAELFKRDGSVEATNDLNLDGHQLKNIGTPVDDSDAVRKVDLDELAARVGGTLINRELVSGVKDGENVTFTLANAPTLATEQIFLNGLLLNAGANSDYSIIDNVITFTVPPQSTDTIIANYIVEGIQLNVDVQATLAAFNGRLTTAEGELFDTEQAVIELGNNADILAGRVSGTESDISALEVRASNIENNIDAVEADLSAEQARAMSAEGVLDSRVGDVEFDVLGLSNRMSAAEGDIVALESADSAMDSRVGNLEDGLQAETVARTSADNALNVRVAALENEDTQVDGRLDVLESDVASLESGLASEASTRLTNDNALQSNINSEIAARTAADSALQSNLNQEIADRFATVSAEEVARAAADAVIETNLEIEISRAQDAEGVLSGRLDEIEAVSVPGINSRLDVVESNTDQNTVDIGIEMNRALDAEAALSGRIDALEADPVSQAYVDQKISDLVNSAPEVLDTLKELSDALGGDENFATTISGQIGQVASDLSSEVSRAQSAEGALDSRIDALEADAVTKSYVDTELTIIHTELDNRIDSVVGNLAQEAIDRGADVDAEEARAMAAESALDARIETLENAPAPVTELSYLSDVTVTSPTNGQVLQFNGVEWVNGATPSTFSGSYDDLTNKPALVQVAFSGSYNDLIQKPNFADVATSGSYADLNSKPDLSVYALDSDLSSVDARVTNVETNKLDISVHNAKLALVDAKDSEQDGRLNLVEADVAALEANAFSGDYNNLTNKPTLASFTTLTSPASGEFLKYNGSAWVNSVLPEASQSVSGIINTGTQTIKGNKTFDASVLTMFPASGTTSYMSFAANYYPLLVGKVNGQPQINATGTGNTLQLKTDIAVAVHITSHPGDYLAGKVGIATTSPVSQLDVRTVRVGDKGLVVRGLSGQTANLFEVQNSAGAAIFSVDKDGSMSAGIVPVARVSGLAQVATSGSYDDLSNKPSIPSLTGYATELYVDSAVAAVVNSAPAVLDTLNELAAALGNDENFATTVAGQIGDVAGDVSALTIRVTSAEGDISDLESDMALKVDASSLATVATSGSYDDLTNKPSLFSGDYNDLSNKPAIPTPTREVPSGSVNGTNVTFTLSQTPSVANTEQVFLNGLLQSAGASDDYTISGDTITFNSAPEAGWKLIVYYFV